MTISQIYDQFHIMPNLQLHMLRVAAVGQAIAQNMKVAAHASDITLACLLHDMGNILKFDLTSFPEFLEPEGYEYWQNIQNEYRQKYGPDEHVATSLIVNNLGVSDRVKELIAAIGFSQAEENYLTSDMDKKIADYADTRVTPFGIVSLEERFQDLEKRYAAHYSTLEQHERRQKYQMYLRQIEGQIFSQSQLRPEQITEESLQDNIIALKNFEIIRV